MVDWTTISDSQVDPNAPITSELMTALRDNPIAIALGAVGAPSKSLIGGSILTTSSTVLIPEGFIATIVAIGAGGSGGAAGTSPDNTAGAVANGGAAGAVAIKRINTTSGSVSLTATIGAGGASRTQTTDGATVGLSGGTTTVTGTGVSLSAGGGSGGTALRSGGTEELVAALVSGGVASGGDINLSGASVGAATKEAGSGVWGNGASSPLAPVAESSGRLGSLTDSLAAGSITYGLTGDPLVAGGTKRRFTTSSGGTISTAESGGLGCGGGGSAIMGVDGGVTAISGAGGSGAVYIILEALN